MKAFIRRLFKSKQKATALDEKDITREAIEEMMEAAGFDLEVERFKTEALHISTLMRQKNISTSQALETVQDTALREELRPFIYAVNLSSAVLSLQILGGITEEQANDLRAYVAKLWEL